MGWRMSFCCGASCPGSRTLFKFTPGVPGINLLSQHAPMCLSFVMVVTSLSLVMVP